MKKYRRQVETKWTQDVSLLKNGCSGVVEARVKGARWHPEEIP